MSSLRDNEMKYPVHFKTFNDDQLIIQVPMEIEPVFHLIDSDIQNDDADYILQCIDKVLTGESTYEDCDGNVCSVEIRKDFTAVINNYELEEAFEQCEIETIELKKIIELWVEEYRKYYQEQGEKK